MPTLKRVRIKGFRSIQEADLELLPINICIGANGAGKSNLVAFFTLINEMMGGRLQHYIGETGRATANLYFGPKVTPQLEAEVSFETEHGVDTYTMRLFHAAHDSLIFAEETLSFQQTGYSSPKIEDWDSGHLETRIIKATEDHPVSRTLRHMLNHCRVYHFHDTSQTAGVRNFCYVRDNRWLMPDAANLAALLYRLKSENEMVYRRIVRTIRQVAPFFEDFDLEPTGRGKTDITLNWRHRQSDLVFGPHQLSDGTLRTICLVSLLSQPQEDLPYLIVVDEPEIGLHPHALDLVASLFRAVSQHVQVLVSTQSSVFLSAFEPEDIVVVERIDEATKFVRQNREDLETWLQDYTLGEIWEKNIIGGGPH